MPLIGPQQLNIAAAVQFEPKFGEVESNLSTARQLAFEAAAKGAGLIVLPELCLGGNVIRDVREAVDVAQVADGYQSQSFLPICQRFNCHIVFGYVELAEGFLYNSAAVVGPFGVEANTRKHNLYGSDNLWAQPSEDMAPIVLTRAGRTGVLICRDGTNRFRETYHSYKPDHRFYRRGSVDTIALLTNWGSGFAYPDSSWVDLVEETRANVVVSNRVGEERDMTFKGGSCIIDRDRRIWTHGSNFDGPAVVGGVIDLG